VTNIPLVLLLGVIATIQVHMAKALERQGIEVFEQLRARIRRNGRLAQGGARKPIIYSVGLVLNNTVFVWAILAQPHGPPALYSSMFGVGLVFLMIYAALVLKERITRREMAGVAAIVLGSVVIGVEGIGRAEMDRLTMDLAPAGIAVGAWLSVCLIFVVASRRGPRWAALAYGILAGGLGSLDPFLKGVGQAYGGRPGLLPSSPLGAVLFASSFVIGFLAFSFTQIGFARKARASLLVPAYNAAYVALPVVWQALLLPAYRLSWVTAAGIGLIIAGVVAMQAAGRGA
jgi:drug/metabolite transporter (DMT)-like permease